MNKISAIEFLMQDAKGEFVKIETYREILNTGDQAKLWNAQKPSRKRIKDDLKMVRRLTLELEEEARILW
ncbi:MAG TPA: hypothetical protein DEQ64_11270 [Lachnoclostridium sp.]|uniref:hypothetical protein n=1 Tax=Lacrimispora sp. TaxID=2719234 RepID=UPI000EDFFB4F|nr:hypothetical protein [Lacrimispora sp.]HCD44295.1 hypothetical protein [Lachnoclostridium sp.]